MKWLRTIILFNEGNVMSSKGWTEVHNSYKRAIESIHHPQNSNQMVIRRRTRLEGGQWLRNGVGYLRSNFLNYMTQHENWHSERELDLSRDRTQPHFYLYPSCEEYKEPITSDFGNFDFLTTTQDGLKVAIEWETGNVSSSHRAMNKLAIALKAEIIQAGVLIVPSRDLYLHLTDRIGNISELSGYLEMWQGLKTNIKRGLLAITVVEHDVLSDDPAIPYLSAGNDGRAKQGRAKLK